MSKKITIIETYDEYECELCGPSYATSHKLKCEDFECGDDAVAHCYDCTEVSREECLEQFLIHLGYEIEDVDGGYTFGEE